MIKLQRQQVEGDPQTRVYHSRTPLTNRPEEMAYAMQRPRNAVLEAVVRIRGVECAKVRPYVLIVRRAAMFEWDEIEPSLLRLIASFNLALPSAEITE